MNRAPPSTSTTDYGLTSLTRARSQPSDSNIDEFFSSPASDSRFATPGFISAPPTTSRLGSSTTSSARGPRPGSSVTMSQGYATGSQTAREHKSYYFFDLCLVPGFSITHFLPLL